MRAACTPRLLDVISRGESTSRVFRSIAVPAVLVLGLAACGGSDEPAAVMPEVTGLQLDVALSDIERAGFSDDVEVLGGGVFGVVDESNWVVCEQEPSAGQTLTAAPRLTVDRSCGTEETEPTESPSEEPTEDAEAYSYEGPAYEIVTIDADFGITGLDQYWVYVSELDVTTDAHRAQVQAIITDIAHTAGTASFIAGIVTDPEIVEAESASTAAAFGAEHSSDNYFRDVVAPKEVTDWVATYTGGFDYDTGAPSDAAEAFEILWWPYGDMEIEKWSPEGF